LEKPLMICRGEFPERFLFAKTWPLLPEREQLCRAG
jgi:hypothetical protein